jgi:predicted metal-dependent hydrolase
MWLNARSEALLGELSLPVPLEIRPMRSARRLRLRFDQRRRVLKLTCPLRTSRRAALTWVAEQRAWIDEQLALAEPPEPLEPGASIPLEGSEVTLVWAEDEPRTPRLVDAELRCGGPASGFGRRIELFLKRRALDVLSSETAEIAKAAGVAPRAVAVGDADTRWGSCSSAGRIRYSWRLILAPPEARRFVVAHEVAHLIELNHGPRFKALERQLFGGDVAAARALLGRVGPRLKGIGGRH